MEELTANERNIMSLVTKGFTNKHIAELLFISEQTVNNHLCHVYDKYFIGEQYNKRARAVYLFLRDERNGLSFKILNHSKSLQRDIEDFVRLIVD